MDLLVSRLCKLTYLLTLSMFPFLVLVQYATIVSWHISSSCITE